jgi:sulfite reductase (ferredoxin)
MNEHSRSRPLDGEALAPEIEREIEVFEVEIERLKRGKLAEEQFRHFRLNHGIYGQRQPGVHMVRVKIPSGLLNARQLEVLADIGEEYGHGLAHVTTRQDVQYHFVELEDVPAIMRRLASVGLTTREACGNTVRNITACSLAGVCPGELFDVTPIARATTNTFIRHPICQQLGRKFKISFSGCADKPCGLAHMHDIGHIARTRMVNGYTQHGFEVWVGGGLGAQPHPAKLYSEFVPHDELNLHLAGILSVFTRYGERKNRNKARMKFLVEKLGIEEFRRRVAEEMDELRSDPRDEEPMPDFSDGPASKEGSSKAFELWRSTNVVDQKQEDFCAVHVSLPLGDITPEQLRAMARIISRFNGENLRATVEQNLLLRWVRRRDLWELYSELEAADLAEPGAETLLDITACPGADTCILGITSSKGLAVALRKAISDNGKGLENIPEELRGLSIKVSGCPNSCGQHHIADIGFFGSSQRVGGNVVPNYHLFLGGQKASNALSFGLATIKVPAKKVPSVVDHLVGRFRSERMDGERFSQWVERVGKKNISEGLAHLRAVADFEDEPGLYVDWDSDEPFSVGTGQGECAGQLVALVELKLDEAERDLFEANLNYERGNYTEAAQMAFQAMKTAAQGLLVTEGVTETDVDKTREAFRARFIETDRVFEASANYFAQAEPLAREITDKDEAYQRVDKASLFVDECQMAYSRMQVESTRPADASSPAVSPEKEAPRAEAPAAVQEINAILDLKGVECPINFVKTKLQLETMASGQLLEVTLDEGEPIANVPESLRREGHDILEVKKIGQHYRVLIQKA